VQRCKNNQIMINKFLKEGKINGCKNPLQINSLFNLKILYNLNPEMKIIICMRNPMKAIISLYFMLKKNDFDLHRRRFKMRQNGLKIKYYNIITMNSKRPIMTCSCSSCFSLIRRVFR
jgi:hypothetical protein